jgi:hypothetical protein
MDMAGRQIPEKPDNHNETNNASEILYAAWHYAAIFHR